MGRVFVRGVDALALVQACCTRDVGKLADGQAAYSLLCLPNGGVLDDVIVYRLEPREILLVVNASNREADVAWLSEQSRDLHLAADVDDHTLETALIGVQGPRAQQTLQPHAAVDLEPLPGYAFVVTQVAGRTALVARTGYTGEDGFEVLVQAGDAAHVWDTLLASDAVPCGLGARDTLRTEAGMPLYGHELDETTNPYEARLGWAVDLDKGQFVGRAALESIKSQGPSRRLVGLRLRARRRASLRRSSCSKPIESWARLTSGTFSPTLKRPIGLGYVPIALSRAGQRARRSRYAARRFRPKWSGCRLCSAVHIPAHPEPVEGHNVGMSNPADRRYTAEHEWIKPEGEHHIVGITAFAQDQLGDIVYVELPRVGDRVEAGQAFGVIESVKTASDLYAPVSGEVVEVNSALVDQPQVVNDDPYTEGWMIKIKVAEPAAVEQLLTAEQYAEQTGE